jgi:phosphatidate cytidylyltransferase
VGIDPDLGHPELGHPELGETPEAPRPAGRTGRNLPVAIAVGLGLGGLALVTLFTVKFTFLVYVAAIVAMAGW